MGSAPQQVVIPTELTELDKLATTKSDTPTFRTYFVK